MSSVSFPVLGAPLCCDSDGLGSSEFGFISVRCREAHGVSSSLLVVDRNIVVFQDLSFFEPHVNIPSGNVYSYKIE